MEKLNKSSIIALLLGIFIVLFTTFKIISIYLGSNPLNHNQNSKAFFVSVFPEGWTFFTKSSKDSRTHIFSFNGESINNVNLRNFSSDYYFGISRHNRVLNVEISNIMKRVEKDSMKSFIVMSNSELNFLDSINVDTLNFSDLQMEKQMNKNFVGKYLIASQTLPPWSLLSRKSNYPSKFIVYPINIIRK